MKRGTSAALASAVLTLVSAGCGAGGISGNGSLDLDQPEFSVDLPQGWKEPSQKVQDRADRFTQNQLDSIPGADAIEIGYEFVALTTGGRASLATVEVAFEPVPANTDVATYVQASSGFEEQFGAPLSNEAPYDVGDLDGDETVSETYDQAVVGTKESSWLTVQAIHDDTGVTINMNVPKGEFARYEDDLREILASWTWD